MANTSTLADFLSISQGPGDEYAGRRPTGALGAVAADLNAASRNFWKKRSQALEAEIAEARRRAEQAEAARRRIEDDDAVIARLKPGQLPAGIGRLTAAAGPFDAWIVALSESGKLQIVAASREAPALVLDARSALFDSFSRASAVSRLSGVPRGAPYREDRLFPRGGFPAYLCVPFVSGAIALAARAPLDPAAARTAEARAAGLVGRLAPTIDAWTSRREMCTQRALVQSLAIRLCGAIDAERARIARDLHDDQAQLITAARIALEAPGEKARRLLREVEQTLRTRMRDLRPVTIGRATLKSSLEGERQRLIDAGLHARLVCLGDAHALTRPLQNVCWQVAREAVSNVIRHARAKHVEVSLERAGDFVRLKVADDGCGARRNGRRQAKSSGNGADIGSGLGFGLTGLAERVALIGGRLQVNSLPNGTCVVAEIPALIASRGRRLQR